MDNSISSNNELKESKNENLSNTATDSFFKAYEVRDIEKQSQTKCKYSNTSNSINELPNIRRCKAEKFKAIQYSLGPNEEYIAIRSYEYDIWERNEDNMSIIYQDIFQKKDEGWKALIEISSEYDFMESIVIAIPVSDGKGHTLATVEIEYEWKPPRCSLCSTFDHNDDMCPKCPKETTMKVVVENDGFIKVKRKKNKSKQPRQVDGIRITKPSLNLHYKRVEKVVLKNSFASLPDKDASEWGSEGAWNNAKRVLKVINKSDSEDVDQEIIMGERSGVSSFGSAVTEGASTPGGKVPHD
ncbi:hypothetical protein Tco_1136902 [Tanacetum coccineum]